MSKKFIRQDQSVAKHPHYSSTQPHLRNPLVPTTPGPRPEWRGPGFVKSNKRAPPKVQSKSEREEELKIASSMSVELQQKLLDVFRIALPVCTTKDYDELRPLLAAVKTRLDDGDAEGKVFGEEEMREVFLVRWGSERALMLAGLLVGWAEGAFKKEAVFKRLRVEGEKLNVVSFGSGAAEMMALSAFLRHVRPESAGVGVVAENAKEADAKKERQPFVELQLVQDPADWATETKALHAQLLAQPEVSKYASAAVKAAACPYLAADTLAFHSHSRDALAEESKTQVSEGLMGSEPCLITMCFSLREMQHASVVKTAKFLIDLTKAAPSGSLLLVVDEMEGAHVVGDKKYPLRFLLDLALLGKTKLELENEKAKPKAKGEESEDEETKTPAPWERLVGDEERYFKVDPALKYPLSLAKVGVQVYLFKKR